MLTSTGAVMRRPLTLLLVLALVGATTFLFVTRAQRLPPDALAGLTADPAKGERVFWAAGCASCHMAPGATGEARLVLSGGQRFASPFGTFVAPNISPDPDRGIGGWSVLDLANAMQRGVSPEGKHYFPVFPYASYIKANAQDVADLHAYLMTLPPSTEPSLPHEVGFPFSIRRLVGGWKFLYLNDDWAVPGELPGPAADGRYLAEALGHCGECHTPRDGLGGLETGRWFAGGPIPGEAQGRFPNITPAVLTWSEGEIADYLDTGFTPDYDSAGGHMALVVENMARLTPEDRAAIAAYLKAVPPVPEEAAP
jgi:mono/diheme cytochrome c family protein